MKIALVHDYIKEYGGAERVLETLYEIYPEADVYTSVYLPEFLGPHKKRFEKMRIHTSFFQYVPFNYKLLSPFRIISPLAFFLFNFSKYDAVIVSQTGAYFPNCIRKGGAKHICYTHTPPRYLYGYMTARNTPQNIFVKGLMLFVFHFLRMIDFASSKNVDAFIANSFEVKSRIDKFYRREATVVYPPVEIKSAKDKFGKSDYYLAGGRLARAKGIDVIVDAFIKNGKPLKIFGRGFAGFEEELKAKVKKIKNVQFVGEVGDEEKLSLMKGSRAYIFASYDEDFGITPVEAMGQGTPVIAYKSGGVKETVVDPSASSGQAGATGVFYNKNTPDALNQAIEKFEKANISKDECVKQAKKFEKKTFINAIKKVVEQEV